MKEIPRFTSESYTFSAIIVGLILIEETTTNEQNTIGNWLMLVAQILSTNAFYKEFQNEETSKNDEESIDTKEMLKKIFKALRTEIDNIDK